MAGSRQHKSKAQFLCWEAVIIDAESAAQVASVKPKFYIRSTKQLIQVILFLLIYRVIFHLALFHNLIHSINNTQTEEN